MKNKKLFLVALIAAPFMLSLTGCSGSSGDPTHVIRILNLDDYIYLHDKEDPESEADMVKQFEEYANELFGFEDVHVIYEVSDTNESEYNDLLTGRIKYDLVCTSDYMLQKFVREDLVVPLDKSLLTNYNQYASPLIKERLDQISIQKGEETVYLEDYAVGYMWGTLGLLISPKYFGYEVYDENDEFTEGMIKLATDTQSWDILWDGNYKNAASIKNSMRDTVAVALMHGYDEDFNALKEAYWDGSITAQKYNEEVSKLFNPSNLDDVLPTVKEELSSLKGNVFGLEVDSGKQDIITGKIGLNLAWSGDAVYSMDEAENLEKLLPEQTQELFYAVPENGSNIWFDGWAMPKNEGRADITRQLATVFLDFISSPEKASLNMDYTGYTSFIGGDEILDLVFDWYDIRTYLVSYQDLIINEKGKRKTVYYDVYYFDPVDQKEVGADYKDCHFSDASKPDYDDVELYYYDNNDVKHFIMEEDEDGSEVIATYNSYFLLDDYEVVDLNYFFAGTLSEERANDTIVYSDCYLPFKDEFDNISVGRQFFCQYPDEETILRCAIMDDYGDQNIKVVKLWEEFKSNPLPVWGIVLLIVEVALVAFGVTYFYLSKRYKKKLRLNRNK